MKKILIITLACLVTSCISKKKAVAQNVADKEEIKIATISNSTLFGSGDEGIGEGAYVIKSQKEWEEFKVKLNTENNVTSRFKNLPVDFSKKIIIAIFSRVQNSGGITVKLEKVIEEKNKVSVYYSYRSSDSQYATMVINQPYYIGKIDKTNKKIEFITNNE